MKFIDLIIRPLGGATRTPKIVGLFKKELHEDQKILDLGAGGGEIAKYITGHFKAEVTLLDVLDYNKTDLKLILYNGKKIPFKDNSFDIVLIIFVLHHTKDQINLLKEAKRIGQKIIIFEDTPKNRLEYALWKFWDWFLNLGHGVSMVYSSKKEHDWLHIFKKMDLKLVEKKNFRHFLPAMKSFDQTMFILEKR